jgi:hypothetical protein
MADATEKPKLLLIAEHLQRHGVEFMVIGGQAGVLQEQLPAKDEGPEITWRAPAGGQGPD